MRPRTQSHHLPYRAGSDCANPSFGSRLRKISQSRLLQGCARSPSRGLTRLPGHLAGSSMGQEQATHDDVHKIPVRTRRILVVDLVQNDPVSLVAKPGIR